MLKIREEETEHEFQKRVQQHQTKYGHSRLRRQPLITIQPLHGREAVEHGREFLLAAYGNEETVKKVLAGVDVS